MTARRRCPLCAVLYASSASVLAMAVPLEGMRLFRCSVHEANISKSCSTKEFEVSRLGRAISVPCILANQLCACRLKSLTQNVMIGAKAGDVIAVQELPAGKKLPVGPGQFGCLTDPGPFACNRCQLACVASLPVLPCGQMS